MNTDPKGSGASPSGATDAEAARVRAVYAGYQSDPRTMAKWNLRNRGNACIRAEHNAAVLDLLARGGVRLGAARFLDVGCGSGGTLGWLAQCGARQDRLYGVDLREDQIALARAQYPRMQWLCADARRLPFADQFFDVIVCSVVFSSILDEGVARAAAAELRRLVRSTGMIVWSEPRYRNPWNPHVRGYTGSDIQRLFPGCRIDLRTITVLPALARRLGRFSRVLYPMLARLPFLRVKYLGAIRPKATDR